jgi:hypothetical protein
VCGGLVVFVIVVCVTDGTALVAEEKASVCAEG